MLMPTEQGGLGFAGLGANRHPIGQPQPRRTIPPVPAQQRTDATREIGGVGAHHARAAAIQLGVYASTRSAWCRSRYRQNHSRAPGPRSRAKAVVLLAPAVAIRPSSRSSCSSVW